MLHAEWSWPSITKPAAAAIDKCYTETLPNVLTSHAELRSYNSVTITDGANDRAKGAHSLPDRENNVRTRDFLVTC